jgi:hypothetical protein
MNADEVVTGITVAWNTREIAERAYKSFRKFHPTMQLIVVDGSFRSNPCFDYICSLADDPYTRVFHVDKNIGHGRGLHFGISKVGTPFALIFDSDVEILKSPIQAMLDMMEDDTYGIGNIEKTAYNGHEWGSMPQHKTQGWMRYLHPFFCLIQIKEYYKYNPYIHHGAPAVNISLDIHRRGLGNKVIKEFPGIWHTSGKGWVWTGKPSEWIRHDTRGTCGMRNKQGLEGIEGVWDRVIDNGSRRNTCITCTGDRQLAFSLCRRWMENQTVVPDQWIVIDDGQTPMDKNELGFATYYRRQPKPGENSHQSMIANLREALKHVTGDRIFIIEDDEYYSPRYIEEMTNRLDKYEVVGIGRSKYYHLPSFRYAKHGNMGHASLAQTCFRRSFLQEAIAALDGDAYYDIRLWKLVNGKGADGLALNGNTLEYISPDKKGLVFDDVKDSLYSGMKGLPGRTGIGSGHKGKQPWYIPDINKNIIKSWITKKDDLDIYLNLFPEMEKEKVTEEKNIPKSQVIVRRGISATA